MFNKWSKQSNLILHPAKTIKEKSAHRKIPFSINLSTDSVSKLHVVSWKCLLSFKSVIEKMKSYNLKKIMQFSFHNFFYLSINYISSMIALSCMVHATCVYVYEPLILLIIFDLYEVRRCSNLFVWNNLIRFFFLYSFCWCCATATDWLYYIFKLMWAYRITSSCKYMAINDMDSKTAKGDYNEVSKRIKGAIFGLESMEKLQNNLSLSLNFKKRNKNF